MKRRCLSIYMAPVHRFGDRVSRRRSSLKLSGCMRLAGLVDVWARTSVLDTTPSANGLSERELCFAARRGENARLLHRAPSVDHLSLNALYRKRLNAIDRSDRLLPSNAVPPGGLPGR